MSLHTCPCKPSSCPTFTHKSHWGRPARDNKKKKKKSCVYAHSVASVLSSSLRPCRLRPARLFSQIGGSPGKNTGAYWPILVAIPFWSTIFPTTLAANLSECLVLPEPLWPKQLHHLHTQPSKGQTQVLQGRKQTPVDDPHAEVEIKPQLNPRAVWPRKETQNLLTSRTSCRLSPCDQPGRLCVYEIFKRTLRAPTKETALALTAMDIGGKNTQE